MLPTDLKTIPNCKMLQIGGRLWIKYSEARPTAGARCLNIGLVCNGTQLNQPGLLCICEPVTKPDFKQLHKAEQD